MPITQEKVIRDLPNTGPQVAALVRRHLDDNDGHPLLHVLLGDVARYCVEAFRAGRREDLTQCLAYLDAALTEGEADVEEAVCVSFVENVGPWEPEMQPFIASWPEALRDEAEQQAQPR